MKVNKIIAGIMAVCVMGAGVPYVNMVAENNSAITASAMNYPNPNENDVIMTFATEANADYTSISYCQTSATEVIIPSYSMNEPVKGILSHAFSSCSNLQYVKIPDGVTFIEKEAFYGCNKLTSIRIPESVTSFGEGAFRDTPWLIRKQKENPLVAVNNVLIDGTICEGDVVIPDSITSIGDGAFSGCANVTSVTIPDNVTNIGRRAFYDCSSLTSIDIPESVTSIGWDAFLGTPWLEEKRKENPLVAINNILIDGKTCTDDIVIPESVTSIGDGAFSDCTNITSVTIPDNVTSIRNWSFSKCENLKEITILNPDCDIYDYGSTISNGYDNHYKYYFDGTIYGYENSTAQAYAEKYGYKFALIGTETEKETGSGDMNGDNSVSVADAVLLQQCILGSKTLTEEQYKNADLTGDGLVDSFDMVMLRRKIVYGE